MIDGKTWGPLLFAIGALIIGIWAFLVTIFKIKFGMLLIFGFI